MSEHKCTLCNHYFRTDEQNEGHEATDAHRIAALEAQNKKLVEALATLEAISINAIKHVALANYPEREKKAIAQVEAYFSRARQAAQ